MAVADGGSENAVQCDKLAAEPTVWKSTRPLCAGLLLIVILVLTVVLVKIVDPSI